MTDSTVIRPSAYTGGDSPIDIDSSNANQHGSSKSPTTPHQYTTCKLSGTPASPYRHTLDELSIDMSQSSQSKTKQQQQNSIHTTRDDTTLNKRSASDISLHTLLSHNKPPPIQIPRYQLFENTNYSWKSTIDYRREPERYKVGKGEQGVLICEPYKSEICPYWKFKTPYIAVESSNKIYELFIQYLKQNDFVGADMARKYLVCKYLYQISICIYLSI